MHHLLIPGPTELSIPDIFLLNSVTVVKRSSLTVAGIFCWWVAGDSVRFILYFTRHDQFQLFAVFLNFSILLRLGGLFAVPFTLSGMAYWSMHVR